MNAIEMMAKTMMERAIANLPPEVLATIGQIGQTVVGFKAQLDRIETRLIRIENHLAIPPEQEQDDHDRPLGQDGRAGS